MGTPSILDVNKRIEYGSKESKGFSQKSEAHRWQINSDPRYWEEQILILQRGKESGH